MSLVRSLISAAGTSSRIIGTYVHNPANRASRTPLSSFLRSRALSTTLDSDDTSGGSHSTTTEMAIEVGDNPINILPDISSVIKAPYSAEFGTVASAKSSDTQSESLKPMDRDKKTSYLEEMIKNEEADLKVLSSDIKKLADERRALLKSSESSRHDLLRKSIDDDLSDMRKDKDRLATKIKELKKEFSTLKNPKKLVDASVPAKAYVSRPFEGFVDALLRSPNPIPVVDLSHVNFDNIDTCDKFNEIRGSYSEDRLYRFVMSKESPMFQLNLLDKSFEWDSVDNAVEIYKLPATLRWPTMYCVKQSLDTYDFPEFIIRRMNSLHRHRVNATMNRLWHRPLNAMLPSGQMIVWAGSPGCGKTVAVNEIVLECILKLQGIGIIDNQTKWQFFLRNNNTLYKFFFDTYRNKVSHESYDHKSNVDLVAHLKAAYEKNMNSFVLYELNENEDYPTITMPFLLSTSCRNLAHSLKEVFKTKSHSTYLYDSMLDFEFKFFLDVCFAFGDTTELLHKAVYLDRFRMQGGVLRKIFALDFIDPVLAAFKNTNEDQMNALISLRDCSPLDLNSAVNSIVTVQFDYPVTFEEDRDYIAFRDTCLKRSARFFPSESIPFEYFHLKDSWCLSILSDYIALAIGKHVKFPGDMEKVSSFALCQVQELMSIYGGILKEPVEVYKLPDCFMMKKWAFYECSSANFEDAKQKQIEAKAFRVYTSICYAKGIVDEVRSSLIAKMPSTNRIFIFRGKFLELPFQELSSEYVYRSSVNNCPVFDVLTANPTLKQLFLFQATLRDPQSHPVNIPSFIEALSKLNLHDSSSIDEINFFMIVSAHATIESQHFFWFEIGSFYFNVCYLQEYSSEIGLRALRKLVTMDSNSTSFSTSSMSNNEFILFSKDELVVLKTIGGCYEDDSLRRLSLSSALYRDFSKFLGIASKIKSYICRAPFMAADVKYVNVKETNSQR